MNTAAPKTVDELAKALEETKYQPKDQQALRGQAEQMFKNQRDQQLLSAQQSYDSNAAALQQQLAQLGTSYDRQIESQQEATRKTLAQADRLATARGMGRSSYNNATQANLQLQGDKAVGRIQEDRTAAESSIAAQLTQLQKQLGQNQAAANSQFENNVLAKLQELMDQDYNRKITQDNTTNDLLFKLYQLQQQDKAAVSSSGGGDDKKTPATGDETDKAAEDTVPKLNIPGAPKYKAPTQAASPSSKFNQYDLFADALGVPSNVKRMAQPNRR